jgi:hypothetical protein
MEIKTVTVTDPREMLNTINGFCNQLKATSCEICEDCLTGTINFASDDFAIETETSFRVENYYEDIASALQAAKDYITYYESVVTRLEILRLLKIDSKPIVIEC